MAIITVGCHGKDAGLREFHENFENQLSVLVSRKQFDRAAELYERNAAAEFTYGKECHSGVCPPPEDLKHMLAGVRRLGATYRDATKFTIHSKVISVKPTSEGAEVYVNQSTDISLPAKSNVHTELRNHYFYRKVGNKWKIAKVEYVVTSRA